MRILLLWKGFEIYLKNGKSYLFNFLTTDDYNNFMKDFIYESKIKNLVRKRDFVSIKNPLINLWKNGYLSNYEYLLLLNRYGSRSFNDPSQYPVFPWILHDYSNFELIIEKEKDFIKIMKECIILQKENEIEFIRAKTFKLDNNLITLINNLDYKEIDENGKEEKKDTEHSDYKELLLKAQKKVEKFFRKFKYPPSFQNNESVKQGLFKYDTAEKSLSEFPSHSGCHYSNLAYTYYYLIRQQPYDNLLVQLQGYQLENPNRCFINIIETKNITLTGADNRELIPELFSKIESLLNLNCSFYKYKQADNRIVDDLEMDVLINFNKKSYLSKYVYFIINHRKLLNNKIISFHLTKWIDNVFGISQLPPKENRRQSLNIYEKPSYEQTTNIEEKLGKKWKQKNLTKEEILEKLNIKISHIMNFGICPSQLFKEPHPKLEFETDDNIKEKNIKDNNDKDYDINEEDDLDMEETITDNIIPKELSFSINESPILFKINQTINKIFVYNEEDNLLILDCQLFNEINYNYFHILNYNNIEKVNILSTKENLIYQINYAFSSFDSEIINNKDNGYHTYYYNIMNYLLNKERIMDEVKNMKFDNIRIITCRHSDCSFKIHLLENFKNKNKRKKKDNQKKIYSIICEDFVTACCCISNNSFIIGLNNGKLIYYIIKESQIINNNKQKKEIKNNIEIKKEMYIQGHKGKINVIEIDKRLGIVITSGDDNYIFIRKLYDFELLIPIKLKISTYNFLYILCINKLKDEKNNKIIIGYTLSGIKFAKSEYGLYDNINFDKDGNIITLNNKNKIVILSGSDLTKLKINSEDEETNKIINEMKDTNWLQYNYFMRGQEEELNEIITFLETGKRNNYIKSIKVNNL